MNRKLLTVILLCIIVGTGVFLLKSENKKDGSPPTFPSFTSHQQTVADEMQKEMKAESYKNNIALEITQPQQNAAVTTTTILVKGKTSPHADVFVNDQELKADAAGNFAATISLEEGENPIVVTVNDDQGNSAEQQILVTRSQ
jgi:hypothetical protein